MNNGKNKDDILKAIINNECEYSDEKIAEYLGLPRHTVYALLKEMHAANHLEVLETSSWNTPISCTVGMVLPQGKHFFETMSYEAEEKKQEEEKDLQLRKLKIDTANAERINATYWWTFWFAVLGFAISLLLAILKITDQAG